MIQELGERAEEDGRGFAHLFLEPTRRTPEGEHEFLVGTHRLAGR